MTDNSDLTKTIPLLIVARHRTTELLCCGVAKTISVVGPPGDKGGRTLIVSVSVETKELFIVQS